MPEELQGSIEAQIRLISGIDSKEDTLRNAYDTISNRYVGGRLETFTRLHDLFSESVQDIWNRTGFLHCTNQNYLLALILVKSGRFRAEDVQPKWTMIWYCSPHQYLRVRVGNDHWVDVDPWARHYGISFGEHAKGFNTTLLRAVAK